MDPDPKHWLRRLTKISLTVLSSLFSGEEQMFCSTFEYKNKQKLRKIKPWIPSHDFQIAGSSFPKKKADQKPNPKPVLRIRIRKDPHHFAGSGSGSAPKPMDPDPDPTLFHTKLRKDVLQMN